MLYPGRYESQLKERIFQGMHPHLRDSMQLLYMKEDVGYEEFLAAVCETDMEGSEGNVVTVKAKALTVEKIIDNKEQNELKDLWQQMESLATIMKSSTIGNVKSKVTEGVSLPKKERNAWYFSSERVARITQKREGTSETRAKIYQVP